MTVLAVIPCLNEAAHLPGLIDQMLRDSTIGLLVVADGGSGDGSKEIVKQRAATTDRLVLMDNPVRIQSAGVNLAVVHYGEDYAWLLRIDAHCRYPDGYAATLLQSAQENNADAVVVPMKTVGQAGFQIAIATAQNSKLGTGGSPHRHVDAGRFVDHGHHALMNLAMFRNVGGYCQAMPCNEDAELDHRQGLAGARIWLEPSAAITYFPRRTPWALARQYFKYGIGRARTIERHGLRLKLRQAVPLAVPLAILILPMAFRWPIFALPATIWLFACLVGGTIIGARQGGGWRLLSGAAAAIMHASWGFGFLIERYIKRSSTTPRLGVTS